MHREYKRKSAKLDIIEILNTGFQVINLNCFSVMAHSFNNIISKKFRYMECGLHLEIEVKQIDVIIQNYNILQLLSFELF